jgi:hypothetical protein
MIPETTGYSAPEIVSGLRDHGVVLLRDHARSLDDFVRITGQVMDSFAHHSAATKERETVGDAGTNVVTVNRGTDAIPLHRESSFLPTQPDVLALYCQQPPAEGGQTIVCDGVALLEALPGWLRRFLEGEELVWRFRMPPERWSAVFGTCERAAAEARIGALMRRHCAYATYDYCFDGEALDGTWRAPFILPTFWQGAPALSTSVLGYYHRGDGPYSSKPLHQVTLADGSAVPGKALDTIAACGEKLTVQTSWRAGDMLVVDNSRVMHGRRAVLDPVRRRVLFRMGHYRPQVAVARAPGPAPAA